MANIASIKYDMTMTIPQSGEMKVTIWQKKTKMREEMTTQGIKTVILFDMDANTMYTYMPEQNMAMKTTLDSSMIPQGSTEDTGAIMDYNPTIVGTESIDGKACTVITFNNPGSGSVKEWIWNDKGFPLRMEIDSSEGKTIIEYSNIDFSDIPDSTFVLPAGVQVISTP
jgi:outer membrane lipoprotein-sorting protein